MEQLDKVHNKYWNSKGVSPDQKVFANRGFQEFKTLGLPNRLKDENWKYTNIKQLNSKLTPFKGSNKASDLVSGYEARNQTAIVFVNGILQGLTIEQDDIVIMPLAEYWLSDEYLEINREPQYQNGIEALHDAFAKEGVFIQVPKGKSHRMPIELIFINDSDLKDGMANPSVIINLESHAELSIIERHVGVSSEAAYFSNFGLRAFVAAGARLKYYKLQQQNEQSTHVDHSFFHLQENAFLETFNLSQGAELSRYDLRIALEGTGAEVVLNGIYHPQDNQHIDHQTQVDHLVPHCRSSQLYKGVIRDDSRAVFNGKVFIRKGAFGTDADQLNKNLVIGDRAEVDTKPQMEIDADDVKCAHGATVGSLEPDQLFYLESRGIQAHQAEKMLADGFLNEVAEQVSDPIAKEAVTAALEVWKAK